MKFVKNNIFFIIIFLLISFFITINILINNYNEYKLKQQDIKLYNTIKLINNRINATDSINIIINNQQQTISKLNNKIILFNKQYNNNIIDNIDTNNISY